MSDVPVARTLRWQAALLVCKDCVDRGSGPKKSGSAKALMPALRHATKRAGVRTRVVATTCLGLCPKHATAVARFGDGSARIVAIRSRKSVDAALTALGAVGDAPRVVASERPADATIPVVEQPVDDAPLVASRRAPLEPPTD